MRRRHRTKFKGSFAERLPSVGLAFAALGAAHGAQAQTNATPTPQDSTVSPASGSSASVAEIIVTAQRREENLQRVPVAVTAYDAKALEQRQLGSVADVAQTAPNVQYTAGVLGSGASANITIRGIGQYDSITTTDPGVGVYLDGVYLARTTGASLDLGDVERVEVLRGPQGTLFGRNTIGGALNITTQPPTDTYGGQVEVTVGNLDRYQGRGTLNLPLIDDRLDLRVNALYTQNDGYGRATVDNGATADLGEQREFAGRAELLIKPAATTQVLVSLDGTRSVGTTDPVAMVAFNPAQVLPYPLNGTVPIGPQYVTTNLYNLHYNIPPTDDLNVFGISVAITQELGAGLTLKSISAYRRQSEVSGQDYSASPAQYLSQFIHETSGQVSQEFQLLGIFLGGKLSWVGGIYFFTESDTFDSALIEFDTPADIPVSNRTDSYAAYGQATYRITDKLSLTAGLRFTDERKSIEATNVFGGSVLVPPSSRAVVYTNVSPKGAIAYQFTGQFMAYASISQGFRSGGFNGRPFSIADLVPYAPETTTAYEVGLKSEWLDQRLRLNLAGYFTDYRNIQLTATEREGNNFTVVTGNAATAQIYGFEGEFEARISTSLTLLGGLGLTNDTLQQNPGFNFGSRILPNAPKVTSSVGFNYVKPIERLGNAALYMTASYRSSTLPQFDPTPRTPAYTLVNAEMTFTPTGSPWKFTLYGKNLGDARYWVFAETTGVGPTVAWFGRPREFGAKLAYKF